MTLKNVLQPQKINSNNEKIWQKQQNLNLEYMSIIIL